MATKTRHELRKARHTRIRKRVVGNPERPRLAVFRSLKQIYAQLIDDTTGTTIAAAGSLEAGIVGGGNREGAKAVGLKLAERAKEKGVTAVVFDRGGNHYHGRIEALASGAREGGLEF